MTAPVYGGRHRPFLRRCAGTTQADQRCRRYVRFATDDGSVPFERRTPVYCHQHRHQETTP